MSVSLHRPEIGKRADAEAEVIQLGKSTAFMSSNLYQEEKLVATSTSTVRLVTYQLEIVAKHRNPKTIRRDIFHNISLAIRIL